MTDANPFEKKIYFINESQYNTRCFKTMKKSTITTEKTSTTIGPFTLFEVQDYLMTELSKFIIKIQLAEKCTETPELTQCSATFKNFSKEYLKNIKNGYVSNSSRMPFGNYAYTDSFFESQQSINDKKSLCQRYGDIGSMLDNFTKIVSDLDTDSTKKIYSDKFNYLVKEYNKNTKLREVLQAKMDQLSQEYGIKDSRQKLDSTIYISVLWTILATTTLYYVFKNM